MLVIFSNWRLTFLLHCRLAECAQWTTSVLYWSSRAIFSLSGRSHVRLFVASTWTSRWPAENSRPVCTVFQRHLWLNSGSAESRSLPWYALPLSTQMFSVGVEPDHVLPWTPGSFTAPVWTGREAAVDISEERGVSWSAGPWRSLHCGDCPVPSQSVSWLPWGRPPKSLLRRWRH